MDPLVFFGHFGWGGDVWIHKKTVGFRGGFIVRPHLGEGIWQSSQLYFQGIDIRYTHYLGGGFKYCFRSHFGSSSAQTRWWRSSRSWSEVITLVGGAAKTNPSPSDLNPHHNIQTHPHSGPTTAPSPSTTLPSTSLGTAPTSNLPTGN